MARVSFLVPDIASPVLGPVTALARLIEDVHPVEIVGPDFGHGVCEMYRGCFPYRAVPTPRLYRFPDYLWEARRLSRAITGDIIIAVKAYANTIPIALWHKRSRGARAVAYLDEWDGALVKMLTPRQRWKARMTAFHRPLDDLYYPWVETLIPRMDTVISTTTFLQKRFGGSIVPMGVDMEFFSPAEAEDVAALKRASGMEAGKHLVFAGVVRPHKGIELILDALVHLGNPGYRLVLVGPVNQHVKALLATEAYRPHLLALGPCPHADVPRYLSMADAIVLPLSDNLLAQSQMPCKVFEAMAMGRPLIGSAVADLPLVLDGCGLIVPPNDISALAAAIDRVFRDDALARELGGRAREKCRREFSAGASRTKLLQVLADLSDV